MSCHAFHKRAMSFGRLGLSILLAVASVSPLELGQVQAAAALEAAASRSALFPEGRGRSEVDIQEIKLLAWNVQQLSVDSFNAKSRFSDPDLVEARFNRNFNRDRNRNRDRSRDRNRNRNNRSNRNGNGHPNQSQGQFPRELPPKTEEEIHTIRQIISEQNPDVAVLTEVDNLEALEVLATNELRDYDPLLVPGNDVVIDIGFLVKKDLPWHVRLVSHKELRRTDPRTGEVGPLFSRDLPVLEFRRRPADSDPIFVVVGNHAKSKRGDNESLDWRTDQYKAAAMIVGTYIRRGVRVMMGGDMNADLYRDRELAPVLSLLNPSLKMAGVPREEQVTHTYHPNGSNRPQYSTMDEWLLSKELRVVRGWVVRYKDRFNRPLPLPRTYQQRERQPSDHFPVFTVISTAEIFNRR